MLPEIADFDRMPNEVSMFLQFSCVCHCVWYRYVRMDMYRYAFTQTFNACWACWAQEKFQLLLSSSMFAKALEARAANFASWMCFCTVLEAIQEENTRLAKTCEQKK